MFSNKEYEKIQARVQRPVDAILHFSEVIYPQIVDPPWNNERLTRSRSAAPGIKGGYRSPQKSVFILTQYPKAILLAEKKYWDSLNIKINVDAIPIYVPRAISKTQYDCVPTYDIGFTATSPEMERAIVKKDRNLDSTSYYQCAFYPLIAKFEIRAAEALLEMGDTNTNSEFNHEKEDEQELGI